MRQPIVFKLLWSFPLWMTTSAWYMDPFELKWNRTVEANFKKFRPDIDNLESRPWKVVEELSVNSLKTLCNNVMIDRCPPFEPDTQWIQAYESPEECKLKERVMYHAEALFEEGRRNMTLIQCVYKWFDFWLAEGDDEHVFKLDRDIVDNVWLFDLGPFRVRPEC